MTATTLHSWLRNSPKYHCTALYVNLRLEVVARDKQTQNCLGIGGRESGLLYHFAPLFTSVKAVSLSLTVRTFKRVKRPSLMGALLLSESAF